MTTAVVTMIIVMIYFCKTKYKAEDLKDIYTRNVSICVNNKSILLLGFIYMYQSVDIRA